MLRAAVIVALTLALVRVAHAERRVPRRIGQGFMSKAYLSRDGRHVIKKVRARLGGVGRITKAQRAHLAARSVALMDVLRRGGLPVPPAVVPDGHPGIIVQELAPPGVGLGDLPWRARPRALGNAILLYARAVVLATRAGFKPVLIDPQLANFRFGPGGRVESWFDPVGAVGPIDWLKLRGKKLYDASR